MTYDEGYQEGYEDGVKDASVNKTAQGPFVVTVTDMEVRDMADLEPRVYGPYNTREEAEDQAVAAWNMGLEEDELPASSLSEIWDFIAEQGGGTIVAVVPIQPREKLVRIF